MLEVIFSSSKYPTAAQQWLIFFSPEKQQQKQVKAGIDDSVHAQLSVTYWKTKKMKMFNRVERHNLHYNILHRDRYEVKHVVCTKG